MEEKKNNDKMRLKFYELFNNRKIESAFLFSCIIFYIPSLIINFSLIAHFKSMGVEISRELKIVTFCILLWTIIGPYSTYLVFDKINSLWNYLLKYADDKIECNEIKHKRITIYCWVTIIIALLWIVLRMTVAKQWPKMQLLRQLCSQNIVFGIILFIYYAGLSVLQACGVSALIGVYLIIKYVTDFPDLIKKIVLDNPAEGLKPIGELIVASIICCATGALFFPCYFILANDESNDHSKIIILLILVTVIALVVILYKLYMRVKKTAVTAKNEIVNDRTKLLKEKIDYSINNQFSDSIEGIKIELQIKNLSDFCQLAQQINVEPLDIAALTTTIGTILLPLIVYIQDIFEYIKTIFTF